MDRDPPATPRATALAVRELGHVALFVRDLDAARGFYRDVLGLAETGTAKAGRIVFFSAGRRHHDVSCELARAAPSGPAPKGVPGLYHIAFDVGASLDDLAAARRWVERHGLVPFGETATSFSIRDPDGHEIELYVDLPDVPGARTRQMAATPATSAAIDTPKAGR